MKISEVVRAVESSPDAKKMMGKGFFLSSIFLMTDGIKPPEELHLLFYNNQHRTVIDFSFRDGEVEIGDLEKRDKEMQGLGMSSVAIEPLKAFEIAKQRFDEKIKSKVINYLASLHPKKIGGSGSVVWTVSIIYSGMNVLTLDIDAASGEVLNEEQTNIISGSA